MTYDLRGDIENNPIFGKTTVGIFFTNIFVLSAQLNLIIEFGTFESVRHINIQ